MPVELVVEWSKRDQEQRRREVASTVDAALQVFRCIDDAGEPVLVDFMVRDGACLTIAAGREQTVMCFQASADPPYWVSIGTAAAVGLEHWFYGGSYSEFEQRSLISKEAIPLALREFVETGDRPASISWDEV